MIHDNFKLPGNKGADFSSSRANRTHDPKRDFQKILAKERREDTPREEKEVPKDDPAVKGKESYAEIADALPADAHDPKHTKVSLFDLAATGKEEAVEELAAAEDEPLPIDSLSQEVLDHSLSALFQGYGSKDKLHSLQREVLQSTLAGPPHPLEEPTGEPAFSSTDPGLAAKKNAHSDRFSQGQEDLAALIPQTPPPQTAAPLGVKDAPPPASSIRLKEIIDQIVEKLYTIQTSDKHQTLVTLKHPPLFAGATVVITSYKTAAGEFNITFENLTQAAKQVLDLKENQESLKSALDQKGFTVHIVTTTTLSETPVFADAQKDKGEKGQKERPFDGEKKRNR